MQTNIHLPRLRGARALSIDVLSIIFLAAFIYLGFSHVSDINSISDIGVYRDIGARASMILQHVPTILESEYPPLATSLFWAATALSWDNFGMGFVVLYALVAVGCWIALRRCSALDSFIFALLLPLTITLCGIDLTFGRFDLFLTMLLLVSARAHSARRYGTSGFFFALSICVKIIPILALPVLWIATPKYERFRLSVWFVVGIIIAAVIPIALFGVQTTIENIQYMMQYHEGRAVQIESLWSGISLLFGQIFVHSVSIGFDHMAFSNFSVPLWILPLSKVLIVSGIGLISFRAYRVRGTRDFQMLLALVILFALLFAPVFSPQYIVWVVPLVLSMAIEIFLGARQRSNFFLPTLLTTLIIVAATRWIFPMHYSELLDQTFRGVVMLNVRNAAILIVTLLLLLESDVISLRRFAVPWKPYIFVFRHLLYDAGMFALSAYLFFVVRPTLLPHVSNMAYVSSHGAATYAEGGLPLSLHFLPMDQYLTVGLDYIIPPLSSQNSLHVFQDDCLESLVVNGYHVPDDQLHFCEGSGPGRIFFLGENLHTGINRIEATVRNTGGPIGFNILPVPSLFLRSIVVIFFACFFWFLSNALQSILLLRTPIVSFLASLRYTLRVWILRHFSDRISTKLLQGLQGGHSI